MVVPVKIFQSLLDLDLVYRRVGLGDGNVLRSRGRPGNRAGYFDPAELADATFSRSPAVERDLYWRPITIGGIKRRNSDGPCARLSERNTA